MSEKLEICVNNQITKFEEPGDETTCSIIFENNPKRVYYTGQVVTGCAHIAINKPTVVRGKNFLHIDTSICLRFI